MGFAAKLVIGQTHLIGSSLYGTCTTPANTAAKAVSLDGFTKTSDNVIMTGITIKVKFSYGNTASNPTLNVNGTGAKSIKRHGTIAPGTSGITTWAANSVQSFTFDGTYWMMDEPFDLTQIWNAVYPVGSIYMSVNSTSPATLFGGTWVRIQNQFLLGCSSTYANGATGGEATHTLTAAEMPSHTHTSAAHTHGLNSHTHGLNNHTHGLNSHVHSIGAHAHGLNSHTHAIDAHTHTLSHTHTVTATPDRVSATHKHDVTLGVSGSAAPVGQGVGSASVSGSANGQTDTAAVYTAKAATSITSSGASSTTTSGTSLTAKAASGNTANSAAFNSGAATGDTAAASGNTAAASGNTASTTPGATGSAGSSGAHNNMPPYLAVYIWKRVS